MERGVGTVKVGNDRWFYTESGPMRKCKRMMFLKR